MVANPPEGAVAVVGSRQLDAATFTALRTQRPAWAPMDAVAAWTRMELLAQAAEARNLTHDPASSALARNQLSAWARSARQPADPQPTEIALARTEQWQRFDCGPSMIVHHAVFMKTRSAKPTFAADAMALGHALHERVQPDWDFEHFSAAAKALALSPGIEVRVEQLPAFVEDGRATTGSSGFDKTFAQQAFTLQKPGDFTTAFATSFGVHVIQLEQRLAAVHPTDAAVAAALLPDLVTLRVRALQTAAIESRRSAPTVIAESAASDMEHVVQTLLGQVAPSL